MRLPRLALALLLPLLLVACVSTPERSRGAFVERSVDIDGTPHRYQVFVPATHAAGRSPAVLLFLHGSGERGSDGDKQTRVGIGPYLRAHMDDFPAIVVMPQAPDDTEWSDNLPLALGTLDAATRELNGDAARTYLSGMSMGGYGTWELALHAPQRFAALVPVCAGLVHPRRPSMSVRAVAGVDDPYAAAAARLKHIPIWQFHGAKDDVVVPEYSRRMDTALKAAGAVEARYTEFPDANHNSWDPAYSHTPELWTWLFAQRR